jgi:hypothetical protein
MVPPGCIPLPSSIRASDLLEPILAFVYRSFRRTSGSRVKTAAVRVTDNLGVRAHRLYPILELVVPLHRALRRSFAGDGDLQVDDGLLAVLHEHAVPPLAGFPEFEAHSRFVGRTGVRSGALGRTFGLEPNICQIFPGPTGISRSRTTTQPWAHNLKVLGSNPIPATNFRCTSTT